MDSVRCAAHRAGDVVRENVGNIVGEKTESEFTTKGTLTMEEFRSAGDQLVFEFPTWQWTGNDKTCLITKDVPCSKRVRSLDYVLDLSTTDEDDFLDLSTTDADGWAVPQMADEAHEAHDDAPRTYDLTITYDKYHCVPRFWFLGYDENHKPLDSEGLFEDILTHCINKTVTVDPHPHTKLPNLSIHPYGHAQAMLKVVKNWVAK